MVTGKRPRCPEHRRQDNRRLYERRGTLKQRGYGSRWPKVRQAVLSREPLCRLCAAAGRVTAANVADHIVPKPKGVEDYDLTNLQALCVPCHNAKSARELNAMKRRR